MDDERRPTVLVTGGTGFVASWCIAELLARGYDVRTTVRSLSREAAVRAVHPHAGRQLTVFGADLTSDEGWDAAMTGCDDVLHVASPLGGDASRGETDLLTPAREGTLRVLRAATRAGVRRVVMTSAAASARPRLDSGRVSDETVWADPADPQFDSYRISKILAERAAWDFMAAHQVSTTLTTVLPGAVFGPVLSKENLGSVQIIERLLNGKPPALPRLGFAIVDVRDLADLHLRAMTSPDAAGQRFIAAGEFLWMEEIARTLRARLGPRALKGPARRLPDFAFRALSLVTPNLRTLAPMLGHRQELTSEKARRVLGFSPRSAEATIVDCAERLLAQAADRA